MVARLARSDLHTSYRDGVGKVREHTLVLGSQVIAIDNIGSMRVIQSGRSWWLALFGALIAGGAGSQVQTYGPLVWAGVGFGILLILINMLVPNLRGLLIGTSDGHIAMIESKDSVFLDRLLDLLVEKINSRNPALVASFDIANNTLSSTAGDGPFRTPAPAAVASVAHADKTAVGQATAEANENVAMAGLVAITPFQSAPDVEETLFASEAEAPLKPRPNPEQPVARPATTSASRDRLHDPMLDGPSVARPTRDDSEREWLKTPGRIVYEGDSGAQGSPLRWVLPVLLLTVLAGGALAAWLVLGKPDGGIAISFLSPSSASPSEAVTLADGVSARPAVDVTTLGDVGNQPIELVPTESVSPAGTIASASEPLSTATAAAIVALDPAAVVDFTPPETMVSRSSGQRYRSRPSSADDVPVLAETRAGGEVLQVNGRSIQGDGEWYRVALPEGRSAWFKASLAIPRSRFAESFAAASGVSASFAAASPRILEPAEGAQIPGGPQPVRLAWSALDSATVYIVEIQTFETATQRWSDEPQARRLTVEGAEEVAESLPAAGAWRWRVRGVSAAGEQSQFSRWAAFGIRE